MKKIPSLYQRGADRLVSDIVTPGCEWVLAGEGIPTVKVDGTACMIQGGILYKRYDAKKGKTPPQGAIPCQEAPDPVTGHWPHWVPVGDDPEDFAFRDANPVPTIDDGTYECVGEKVQGNPYHVTGHKLIRHGYAITRLNYDIEPGTTFDSIRRFLETYGEEGIVWYHPDGRMAKIKRKDFGLAWPIKP